MGVNHDWTVIEAWEGDGKAGAAFTLPCGLTVFVTDFRTDRGQPERMTKEMYEEAKRLRDMVQGQGKAREGGSNL